MPVYLPIETKLDEAAAERAAKAITERFVEVANDVSNTAGGILSKMFDSLDGAKARNELKSMQDEYAKLARVAGDAERAQVGAAGNVEVAIKRLHETHDKYGASAAQTAAAENRLTNAWAVSSQAALDAAAANDVAAAAHSRLAQGAESSNSAMLLAAGGIAVAGVAAFEAGKKLFDMGEQWADLTDKVTAATGKIGADAAAMTDQIAEIGNKTAAPIESIGQIYTQLTRLKDLQGDTLNDLTKQVADFDQMNQGAPLNVAMFTRTMQEFHVPAEQAGKDLDILNSAAQSGRVPLNELVQELHNAGPAADIAGLSFGQMANVLASVEESGVNVETALKGFRLALGNIATDSKQLQAQIKFAPGENELQRLKDVIQKIQELHHAGDDIGAIDLGKTVFGRSWADIGQAVLDDKLNVDTLNTSIEQTGPTIEQQRDATKHFGDDWTLVKNQITDALKPLSEHIFDAADKGLQNFAKEAELSIGNIEIAFHDLANGSIQDLLKQMKELVTQSREWHQEIIDSGAGHTGDSGRDHRGLPMGGPPGPGQPAGPAAPTGPSRDTSAPYYPLDLNPADKPGGYESMDQWISSQKAVRSALDHQHDTGEAVATAQQKLADLQDSGKATQEQLNAASEALSRSERDNKQATDDVADAKRKYVEDANKRPKGKDPNENYDPFTEATKHSTGLIPQLASLMGAFAANEALGNPFGKMQAAKKGEDPSNPLYVADVNGAKGSTGGLPGEISNFFKQQATGQAPQPDSGDLPPTNAPPGSIPTLLGPSTGGQPGPSGGPAGAPPSSGSPPSGGTPWWKTAAGQPGAAPSGLSGVPKDANTAQIQQAIITAGRARGMDDAAIKTALAVADAESGFNPTISGGVQGSAGEVSGLFQQSPSSGWGSLDQVNDPNHAINAFYDAYSKNLAKTPNDPMMAAVLTQNPQLGSGAKGSDYWNAVSAKLGDAGNIMAQQGAAAPIPPGSGPNSYAGIGAGDTASSSSPKHGGIPDAPSGQGQDVLSFMQAQMNAFNQRTGSHLSVTADYPGGPTGHPDDGGDHSADRALDFGGSQHDMDAFAAYWANNPALRAATRQLIHNPAGDTDPNNPFNANMNIIGGHLTSGWDTYGSGDQGMGGHGDHDHIALQYIPNMGPPPGAPPPGKSGPAPARAPLPGILSTLFGPPGPASPGAPLNLPGFASGGQPGDAAAHPIAASDTVHAMLTPGEVVVKKDAAEKHMPELKAMNAGQEDPHKPPEDPSKPTASRASEHGPGPASSSRQDSSSVTPPPPGPRIGQGTGPGFGIGGGLIGAAESAAVMAAMGAMGMAEGGVVGYAEGGPVLGAEAGAGMGPAPMAGNAAGGGSPIPSSVAPGGGGGSPGGGAPKGGSGDPMTAVLNRTVGYIGQLTGIAAQGLMSSLIPGASQKGGIMDGGLLSKLAGGIAGAHPSAPNTAGNTPTPLASSVKQPGDNNGGGTTNHIGMQAGVNIGTLVNQNGQSGHDLANDLAFKSYAGYGSR